MTARLLGVLALTLAFAHPALAQLVTTIDAGAATVTYENAYRITAVSLTPAVRYEGARGSLLASGTLSRFETGSFSSYGAMSASVLSSATARLRGELAGSAGGSAHEDGTRTGQYMAIARAHLLATSGGIWLGGGAGQTWDGLTWTTARSGELGGWARRGWLLLAGSVEPITIGDTSYTDVETSARLTRGTFELGIGAGVRSGDPAGSTSWVHAGATWWLGRHLALNAAGGSYPNDYMQGIPGGAYFSLGVRIASRPPLIEPSGASRPRLAPELARPVAGRLTLHPDANGGTAVRLEASGARRVELMGDFTDWKVVELVRTREGEWRFPRPIGAGTHRFNVRVDGGVWGVPRGVTTITDDFEGVVGILTVR